MAIFHKDGRMYVVEGPNPLVKTQEHWNPTGLVFHNFDWKEIRYKGSIEKPPVATEEPPKIEQEEFSKEEPAPKIEPIDQTQDQDEQDQKEFDLPFIKYKVLAYCLPAKSEARKDSLYGESWTRVKYGKKIVFPCIMINSNDIEIEFWTSDPNEKITERSIVYPFSYEVFNQETNSYDRVPYDEYRWWKVSSKEPKEAGWLFKAMPSDVQPDFSED